MMQFYNGYGPYWWPRDYDSSNLTKMIYKALCCREQHSAGITSETKPQACLTHSKLKPHRASHAAIGPISKQDELNSVLRTN